MHSIGKKVFALTLALLLVCGLSSAAMAFTFTGPGGSQTDVIDVPPTDLLPDTETVALDDVGISIWAEDYVAIRQDEDGFVYVFTESDDAIPYVIVGVYEDVYDDVAAAFTDYISSFYDDLTTAGPAQTVTLGGKNFTRVDYRYTVSGYTVEDTRLFVEFGGNTYMFGAKEVPALDMLVGEGYLEHIAASFAPLAGGYDDYALHVDSETSVEAPASAAPFGTMGADLVTGTEDLPVEPPQGAPVESIPDEDFAGSITFTEDVANYDGVWVPFEDGFQLYLPADWSVYELSQEEREAGALYVAFDGSVEGQNPYIEVDWAYSEGLSTLEDLEDIIREASFQVDDRVLLNGIPCVTFSSEEEDITGLIFYHLIGEDDFMFSLNAGNFSADVDTLAAILCSLSPVG